MTSRAEPTRLRAASWGVTAVLLGIFSMLVAVTVGTTVLAVFDPGLDSASGRAASQLLVGLCFAATAGVFAVVSTGGKVGEALERLGFRRPTWKVLLWALLAWVVYVVVAAAVAPLLAPDQDSIVDELKTDESSVFGLVVTGLLVVAVAPLAEEIFFRGFAFAGLRRSMPMLAAAVLSAAAWGSLHLATGNLGVAVQLTLFGIILAVLYERSGSLWAPILAHTLNNAVAFSLLIAG